MSKVKNPGELVERYLQAVRFWMPKNTRQQDLLSELGEDLRSQIEAKEAELGHALDENEVAEILKRCGAPMVVAGSLGPKRFLIGPALYPIYIFVLKMVLGWILIPVFLFILGPVNVAKASNWGRAVAATIGDLWSSLFISAGIITLVFAILERTQPIAELVCKWDPLELPPVRVHDQERKRSMTHTVCELVFGSFALVWLLLLPQHPWLIVGSAAAFLKAGPITHVAYVPIVLLGVVAIVRPAIALVRMEWAWFPPLAEVVQAALSLILVNFMVSAAVHTPGGDWHPFLMLAEAARNSGQYIKVAAIVNASILISLYCAWLGLGIALLVHLWRFLRYVRQRYWGASPSTTFQMQ
jgi:hypothetical protein